MFEMKCGNDLGMFGSNEDLFLEVNFDKFGYNDIVSYGESNVTSIQYLKDDPEKKIQYILKKRFVLKNPKDLIISRP